MFLHGNLVITFYLIINGIFEFYNIVIREGHIWCKLSLRLLKVAMSVELFPNKWSAMVFKPSMSGPNQSYRVIMYY